LIFWEPWLWILRIVLITAKGLFMFLVTTQHYSNRHFSNGLLVLKGKEQCHIYQWILRREPQC
jgi:hypothetical protein